MGRKAGYLEMRGASPNTVFVAHFVRPNPPAADFTNTEERALGSNL